MLKRNKLSLFLLAIVTMLTIYYVNLPEEKVADTYVSVERYEPFLEERQQIIARRSLELEEITLTMASNTDVSDRILLYETVSSLTSRELSMEEYLKTVGYEDALVYVTINDDPTVADIMVSIYDDSFSKNQFVIIYSMLDEEFDEIFSEMLVNVKFIEKT